MQLVVFATIGLIAYLVTYAFGLGGTVAALFFGLFLFTGAFLRVAQPLLERMRP